METHIAEYIVSGCFFILKIHISCRANIVRVKEIVVWQQLQILWKYTRWQTKYKVIFHH